MVRPRLHIVTTRNVHTSEDYDKSLCKIIRDSFNQHKKFLKNMNPKILVSTKGTQDIIDFMVSSEYNTLRREGVDVYAVASNQEIGNNINGIHVKRAEFLRRLREDGADKNKQLIVLHYDILAEGIDVSGFTGIMPLRTLRKAKFLQTYGRSARLDPEDRVRIKSGEIKPSDLHLMNKPYSYIIIPNIVHTNVDDKENFCALIKELRAYDFKPYQDIVTDSYVHGKREKNEVDSLNPNDLRSRKEGRIIAELLAVFEAEEDAKLSKTDLIKKELGIV